MPSKEYASQDPTAASAGGDLDVCDEKVGQCLLYLYGELTSDQVRIFEQQLSTSTDLAEELVRQAEIISLLSGCGAETRIERAFAATRPPHAIREMVSVSLRRYAALVVAIAASVLVIVYVARSKDDSSPVAEDLRIAQAWAFSEANWVTEATIGDEIIVDPIDDFIATGSTETVGPFGDETVPSWMLAALDTSSELLNSTLDEVGEKTRASESENL